MSVEVAGEIVEDAPYNVIRLLEDARAPIGSPVVARIGDEVITGRLEGPRRVYLATHIDLADLGKPALVRIGDAQPTRAAR